MCSRRFAKIFVGELFGTFILVFFGCGASIISVSYNAGLGLFQIALIWGASLTLAIYVARDMSCAHFNPALSVAMFLLRRIKMSTMIIYIISQLLGAALAAFFLLLLFDNSIHAFEVRNLIVRGDIDSIRTAMLIVNFYPNPAMSLTAISTVSAFCVECLGTFFLILMILLMTDDCNVGRPHFSLAPFFIGCLLVVLICIFAPLTQASFNPARDMGPRLVMLLFGWKGVVFNWNMTGILMVYIIAPLSGGVIASFSFAKLMKPLMSLPALES